MSFKTGTGKRSIIIGPGIPIIIDSVLSEKHASIVRYTRFPIESGRLISDHSQDQPEEVELLILATDTPLQDGVSSFEGRHRIIYSQLRIWQRLKVPLIIVLGLRSYINMHIEELTPNKQPSDGKSIKINIKFIEVSNTGIDLGTLAATLAIDPGIAYSATGLVPIGVI